jgi:hypothetical protein
MMNISEKHWVPHYYAIFTKLSRKKKLIKYILDILYRK